MQYCKTCGLESPDSVSFCGRCGHPFNAATGEALAIISTPPSSLPFSKEVRITGQSWVWTAPMLPDQFTEVKTQPISQESVPHSSDVSSHPSHPAFIQGALYGFTGLLIVLALFVGGGLLLSDLAPQAFFGLSHAPISAAPLLLIGAASLGFQALTHPRPLELFKALLVSLAFILWGIDQILPLGWLTTTVGDVVIVLYVIDLGWIMGSALHTQTTWKERRKR